jgi:hypothetical protein
VSGVVALALAALLFGGCATPGPLHVYVLTAAGQRPILDTGNGSTLEVPSFLEEGDRVVGLAYDPYTDHFFLRLEPGDRIRVVDRPARAIKREFVVAGLPAGGGDLALRPRSGHLFLLGAAPGEVFETTRLGRLVGQFQLEDTAGPQTGLAFDPARDELLALGADGRRITAHELGGRLRRELRLAQPAGPSLAFDSERREFHAPLRDRPGEFGIFDETGRLQRTVTLPGTAGLLDLGPRSLIRVF